jgi:hypothetical protein
VTRPPAWELVSAGQGSEELVGDLVSSQRTAVQSL